MGDIIYSTSALWLLLFSPAGFPMLILLVIGIQGFREEVGLKKSQLNIRNIFTRIYQLIAGVGLGIAILADYLATGSYGVWPDIKLKNSKLNTPNIIKAVVPLTLSLALIVSSILTCLGGEKSVKIRLDDKNIYYGKTTAYFVHSNIGYQFHVSSDVYYRMQIGSCYSFTFYMAKGVLPYFRYDYLVTNIAQAAC